MFIMTIRFVHINIPIFKRYWSLVFRLHDGEVPVFHARTTSRHIPKDLMLECDCRRFTNRGPVNSTFNTRGTEDLTPMRGHALFRRMFQGLRCCTVVSRLQLPRMIRHMGARVSCVLRRVKIRRPDKCAAPTLHVDRWAMCRSFCDKNED